MGQIQNASEIKNSFYLYFILFLIIIRDNTRVQENSMLQIILETWEGFLPTPQKNNNREKRTYDNK